MIDFMEEILADIYLFHETPDITSIVFDTLNYEHQELTTRASELLVLLYSPMHQVKMKSQRFKMNDLAFEMHFSILRLVIV